MTTATQATKTAKTKPTKTSPGIARLKKNLGPEKTEALRQTVIADQAKAQAAVAAPEEKTNGKAKTKKAPPAKSTDARKITVLAKENPHEPNSKRARWFGQLKNGMTV